jgi:hypothetical protein
VCTFLVSTNYKEHGDSAQCSKQINTDNQSVEKQGLWAKVKGTGATNFNSFRSGLSRPASFESLWSTEHDASDEVSPSLVKAHWLT